MRWSSLILSLIMLVVSLPPSITMASPQMDTPNIDIDAPNEAWFYSAVQFDDGVLLSGDGIYQYKISDNSLTLLQSFAQRDWQIGKIGSCHFLIRDQDQIYSYEWELGVLYRLKIQDNLISFSSPIKLNLDKLSYELKDENGFRRSPLQAIKHGNDLYMLFDTLVYGKTLLINYNLQTNQIITLNDDKQIAQICKYSNDFLLVVHPLNRQGMDSIKDIEYSISSFSLKTGEFQDIQRVTLPSKTKCIGLTFDEQHNTIFFSNGQSLYRSIDGEPLVVCEVFLPGVFSAYYSGSLILISENNIALVHRNGISIRKVNVMEKQTQALRIIGDDFNNVHRQTIKSLPELRVTIDKNPYITFDGFYNALLSKSSDFDIFVLKTNEIDIPRLIKKGYAADLSSSPIIRDFLHSLYPQLQATCTDNNIPYLLPVNISARSVVYHPPLFKELALQTPTSLPELLELHKQFVSQSISKEVTFIRSLNPKKELIDLAIQLYAFEQARDKIPPSFKDETLITNLNLINTLDLAPSIMGKKIDSVTQINAANALLDMPALFYFDYNINLRILNESLNSAYTNQVTIQNKTIDLGTPYPLLISSTLGKEPVFPIVVTVMGINPFSPRVAEAIKYLELYTTYIDDETKTLMNPALLAPIANPNYQDEASKMDENLALRKSAIETATGVERTNLEKIYNQTKDVYEKKKAKIRYIIERPSIELYHSLMLYCHVEQYSDLSVFLSQPVIENLINRYAEGQISTEHFVMEIEKKLKLMRYEHI